jgi:hypothetical protein
MARPNSHVLSTNVKVLVSAISVPLVSRHCPVRVTSKGRHCGDLSVSEKAYLSIFNGKVLQLLQLDDLWTSEVYARSESSVDRDGSDTDEIVFIVETMKSLLATLERDIPFLHLIAERAERADADMSAYLAVREELSDQDRNDLDWIIGREGGLRLLLHNAADILSTYEAAIAQLDEQIDAMALADGIGNIAQSDEVFLEGDLSRKFRCALGLALCGGTILTIPTTVVGASSVAATATAAAISGAIMVGASGGIAALAILAAAIFFIRGSKC